MVGITMNANHKDYLMCPRHYFQRWASQNSGLCWVNSYSLKRSGLLKHLKNWKKKGSAVSGKTLQNSGALEKHNPYLPMSYKNPDPVPTKMATRKKYREIAVYLQIQKRKPIANWGFQNTIKGAENNSKQTAPLHHRSHDPTAYVLKALVLQWNGLLFGLYCFFPRDHLLFKQYCSLLLKGNQ